ncbi:MAG: TetR/AcrR family transcriptional regulator [Pseudonocardiaceae bacterium]
MRTTENEPKQRLLAGTVEYLAANGLGDISLRRLATALGTSHRMLIYHFGSKEGLLIEVVRAVEQRQREVFSELQLDPDASPEEIAWNFWQRLADPAMWPAERLFFELYGRALQGDPSAVPLLDGIVEHWLAPATAWGRRQGIPAETARANARLGVAVTRGLLLDLLATGDRAGVDHAMTRFLAIYQAAAQRTADPGHS